MSNDEDFWKGKKVFVTGGAGFIGSGLTRELLKLKADVVVYDNLFSGSLSNLEEIKDEIKFIEGDILNKDLDKTLKDNKIEFVFNLAAEPYIPYCYDRPDHFFEVNANGTLNVLMSSKKAGVKRIIQYSTSEVYGSAKQVPMDEHHRTLPLSTYAVSKLAADRLCYTLHHEQKIPVIIMRQFNVYGQRETQPYVIPEIITQMDKSNKLHLGNIMAKRDFTFVSDAAKAAINLMQYEEAVGEVVNVGSGVEYSIEELAHFIAKIMGKEPIEIEVDSYRLRPMDVERLQCNYFKLLNLTGWKPKVGIKEGLKATIEDFYNHDKKWLWETEIRSEKDMWKDNGKCVPKKLEKK